MTAKAVRGGHVMTPFAQKRSIPRTLLVGLSYIMTCAATGVMTLYVFDESMGSNQFGMEYEWMFFGAIVFVLGIVLYMVAKRYLIGAVIAYFIGKGLVIALFITLSNLGLVQ